MTLKSFVSKGAVLGLLASSLATFSVAEEILDRDSAAVLKRVGSEIEFLASDELEGRDVGTPGIEAAAEYIRDEFKQAGLKSGVEDGSYYQPFEIQGTKQVVKEATKLVITGPDGQKQELEVGKDFQPQLMGKDGPVSGELVFVGYGIAADDLEYNEYKDLDVEGKIVVVLRREPQQKDEESVFNGTENSEHALIRTKLFAARKAGAAAIFLVNDFYTADNDEDDVLASPEMFGSGGNNIPFAHVKQSVLAGLLKAYPVKVGETSLDSLEAISTKIDEDLKPVSMAMTGWTATYETKTDANGLIGNNVIGIIEGEGPHADETIVIGGHYDHLGMGLFGSRTPNRREVHNGADDNATGTVAVVELARRFAAAETKPARRLVFVGFSGEERGLLGSRYYVENPVIPLDKTVAMVNFDMIGWLRDDALTIYGAGTSPQFTGVIEAAGEGMGLDLKPIRAGFAGSDHLPFQQRKIPAVFLHTGLTSTYHTPDDDYDTINVEGCVRVIDYSEKFVQELCDLEETPTFADSNSRPRRPRPAYLGARINFAEEADGMFVEDVTEDSPAAKAGLKTGDIVVSINDKELKTREDVINVLQENRPGTEITLNVKRGEEEMEIKVELGRTPR